MRYDSSHKFWVVVNATPVSELGDVLFEASLADLELQIKGGLSAAENPTLFTSREEAETEAHARLVAAEIERQARVLADRVGDALRDAGGIHDVLGRARKLELRDESDGVLLDVELSPASSRSSRTPTGRRR